MHNTIRLAPDTTLTFASGAFLYFFICSYIICHLISRLHHHPKRPPHQRTRHAQLPRQRHGKIHGQRVQPHRHKFVQRRLAQNQGGRTAHKGAHDAHGANGNDNRDEHGFAGGWVDDGKCQPVRRGRDDGEFHHERNAPHEERLVQDVQQRDAVPRGVLGILVSS